MKNIMVIICFIAVCSSCKTARPLPAATADTSAVAVAAPKPADTVNMLDASWQLESEFGTQLNQKNIPLLTINSAQKSFSGSTGCNRMSGTFSFDMSKIKFNEQIITTKMACEGYNENNFINTLLKVNAYKVQDSVLELSQNDIVLLSFKKK